MSVYGPMNAMVQIFHEVKDEMLYLMLNFI